MLAATFKFKIGSSDWLCRLYFRFNIFVLLDIFALCNTLTQFSIFYLNSKMSFISLGYDSGVPRILII